MNVASFTEAKSGGVNEDALECAMHPKDDSICIVALADGQGGRTGGAPAAQTAVKHAMQIAKSASVHKFRSGGFWAQLLFDVDKAVFEEPDAGFTTFVAAAINAADIDGVSSGDSRAVLINPAGEAVVLTADQRKNPPVGSGMCHPTPFSAGFAPDSQILLMSDGVFNFVSAEIIRSTVVEFDARSAIQSLRAAAVGPSKTLYDDFSLVIVET